MNFKKNGGFELGVVLGISIAVAGVSIAEKETNQTNSNAVSSEQVQKFSRALQQIKAYYVKPVSDEELFDNAISGMLSGLDPHSNYLDSKDFKELTDTTKGEFSGLGLEITMDSEALKVISPLDEGPAAKAGIKPGDIILAIDNTPVAGLTLNQAVQKMRGQKGTTVTLTIARKGEEKLLKIPVTREVVQVKSVKAKLLNNKYGYIKISSFQLLTADDVIKSIGKLNSDAGGHIKGLVLDLRNDPGGLLDSAIDVSDAFLDSTKLKNNRLIVYTKGRTSNSNFQANATPGDILDGAPIVVLVNGGSASASEIVAAALQDQKRAIIVGTRSFGKGSVQTVLPLDQNSGVKLTTALYYTPSGKSIQSQGIIPDVVVEDIDMSQARAKENPLDSLKEANLKGHIVNANGEMTKYEKQDISFAFSDPQLNSGLNILQGLIALENQQNTTHLTEQQK